MPPVRRGAIGVALVSLAVVVAPASAQAPNDAAVPRIAGGVTAGGVDIAGLTVLQAAHKLAPAINPHLRRDLVLGVAGHPWRLRGSAAGTHVNATQTAKNALAHPQTNVPLVVSHDDGAVRAFVKRIAGHVYVAPRDATMHISLRHISIRRSRTGVALATTRAIKLVNRTLDSPTASRVLHLRLSHFKPKTTANDLRRTGGTVITVDQAHFKLRLFKGLKFARSYPVAVGQPAYPTPRGLFHVQDKQVNPVWSVPNSPWAGELAGTTVDGGSAANPLKARWMGLGGGVGIHGTGEDASIGTRASHGCVRMHVGDVIALYKRVPAGTPVLIG